MGKMSCQQLSWGQCKLPGFLRISVSLDLRRADKWRRGKGGMPVLLPPSPSPEEERARSDLHAALSPFVKTRSLKRTSDFPGKDPSSTVKMFSPDHLRNLYKVDEKIQSDADFEQFMCSENASHENDFTWLSAGNTSFSYLHREKLQSLETPQMDYLLCDELMDSIQRDLRVFHRSGTPALLLDLEREDVDWGRDEMDALGPDFPSPSYRIRGRIKTRCPSLLGFSPASPGSVFQLSPAGNGGEEPLFWPFNRRSYSEFQDNYLGISPRASMIRIKKRNASKSIQFRVQRNGEEVARKGAARGMIAIRSGRSADRRGDKGSKNSSSSQVSRTGRGPSRLSRSSRHQLNSVRRKNGLNKKVSLVQWLLEFESGYFQVFLSGGMSVESLVGLEEFDGC